MLNLVLLEPLVREQKIMSSDKNLNPPNPLGYNSKQAEDISEIVLESE